MWTGISQLILMLQKIVAHKNIVEIVLVGKHTRSRSFREKLHQIAWHLFSSCIRRMRVGTHSNKRVFFMYSYNNNTICYITTFFCTLYDKFFFHGICYYSQLSILISRISISFFGRVFFSSSSPLSQRILLPMNNTGKYIFFLDNSYKLITGPIIIFWINASGY